MSVDASSVAAEVLAFLVGTWRGHGTVSTPSMPPRAYDEIVRFELRKPTILEYWQRSTDPADGSVLHGEAGVWRVTAAGALEVTVAIAGATEVSEGTIATDRIDLETTAVARAATSTRFAGLARHYSLSPDRITYSIELATVSYPLTGHLRGELRRAQNP